MIEKLKKIRILEIFPDEALQKLGEMLTVENVSKDAPVFRENDPGSSLYIVESGKVEIRKGSRVLSIIEPGNIFGEMSLFEDASRSADAVAKTDVSLYKVNNGDFRRFIFDNPQPGLKFLFGAVKEISRRLRRTSEYLITVYDTGRIVSAGGALEEISEGLIGRLFEELEATGAMMLIYNRFTDFYDVVYSRGTVILDGEDASRKASESSGERIMLSDDAGVLLGEPVTEDGMPLGYIIFERTGDSGGFTTEQMITLSAVASQAGLGILKAYSRQDEEARRRLEEKRMGGA